MSGMGEVRRARSSLCLALALVVPGWMAMAAGPAFAAGARGETDAAGSAVGIRELLQNYTVAQSQAPARYEAKIDGRVQSFFGRHTFTGVVTHTPDGASTHTSGAPWYIPEDLSADLVDISGELDKFDLRLEGVAEGDDAHGRIFHVVGIRKPDVNGSARRGEFWIRESDWRIVRIDVQYVWGTVEVHFTYEKVGEYLMVSTQDARIHPYGVRLRLSYEDYRIGS